MAATENSSIVREEQVTPVSKKVKIDPVETITKPNIEEEPVKPKTKKNKKVNETITKEEETVIEKSPIVLNKKNKKIEKIEKVSKEIKILPEMEELLKITANKKIKNKKSNNKNKNVNGKFDKKSNQKTSSDISDNRLRAFGINPKKFHNKIKYGNQTETNKKTPSKKK